MKATPRSRPEPSPAWHESGSRLWIALSALAALALVLPLWRVRDLPMVDLPQHLYALDVMARLHDPATLYAKWFATGFHPTPYVGYYGVVHLLDAFLPLEAANKLFLSAMVLAWPLSIAWLLRALGRPLWPAWLAAPCVYGDCFGWGFINTLAGTALAIAALASFARLLSSTHAWRTGWAVTAALGIATLAMHPVPLLLIAAGAPAIALLVAAERGERPLASRLWIAFSAWLPALVLALLWAWSLRGATRAAGGSASAMPHETFAANLQAFPWLLANLVRDGSEGDAILLAAVVALVAIVARAFSRPAARSGGLGRAFALPALASIATLAYFQLPLSIQPHIQYLSPRFAPLAAALWFASLPRLGVRIQSVLAVIACGVPLLTAAAVDRAFQQFDAEAGVWHVLAADVPPRSTILNLPFETSSPTIHHPVFLHGAATLARLTGGVPSYSLAGWAQSPFHWKGERLPATTSEWDAAGFDFARDGQAYDVVLVRGAGAERVPAVWADSAHRVVRTLGPYTLVRRSLGEIR